MDLFSQKKLYEALREQGHDVSARTVRRWIEGDAVPGTAWQRAILSVLDTTKEPPGPPEWAEGLANKVADRVIASLVAPDQIEAVAELAAELRARLPQRSGVPPVRSDTGDRDEEPRADPIAESFHGPK